MGELNAGYLTIGRAAYVVGVSTQTITRWYKWWESDGFEHPSDLYLPPYYHKDKRRTKHFKKEDIMFLKEFRNKLQTTHKGVMADFNAAYQWGKRGEKILENRETTSTEIKKKMR